MIDLKDVPKENKKLVILYIYDILLKYSDNEHRMTQNAIQKILADEYSMTVNKKTIGRNLSTLLSADEHIQCKEAVRQTSNGKIKEYLYGYYYDHDFKNEELRMLIDSVMYQMQMPKATRKKLIDKLCGLSSTHFKKNMKHIIYMPDAPYNISFYKNIETISNAINNKKQLSFKYCSYDSDLKLHPRTDKSGKKRVYIVNPYQTAIQNGKYYLICNNEKFDDIGAFRIDRIKQIEILDTPLRSERELNLPSSLNLAEYMKEHLYMHSGEIIRAEFRAKKYMLNDFVDFFGKDIKVTEQNEDVLVTVRATSEGIFRFAVQFAGDVLLTSPDKLRDRIKDHLKAAFDEYNVP